MEVQQYKKEQKEYIHVHPLIGFKEDYSYQM